MSDLWSPPGGEVDAPQRSQPTDWSAVASPQTVPGPGGATNPASTATAPIQMALGDSPVARLQPRTVGQLLDGGFEVLRYRFATISIVAGVIVLPLYVLPQALLAATGLYRSASDAGIAGQNPFSVFGDLSGFSTSTVVLSYVSSLGLMLASMLVGVGITHQVAGWLVGVDHEPAGTLRFVLRRTPVAVGAFLLALLIKMGGAVLCGIGLLFIVPLLSVLAPVIGAEPVGAGAAVGRALSLTRRRLGPVMGVSLLWALTSGLVVGGISAATAVLGFFVSDGGDEPLLIVQALNVVATVVLMVVQVAVTVLVYVDLQVRTEALDLELEAQEHFRVTP